MNQVKNILYLGWLGKGNLGDELLYQVFKEFFYRSIDRSKSNSEFNIDAHMPVGPYKTDLPKYELVVLGGGSIFHLGYWLDICIEAQNLNIPVVSWGTGIDGMFKANLTDFKEKLNLPEDLREKILKVTGSMGYISCRGAYTKESLISLGVPTDSIHVIADPALFYNSRNKSKSSLQNKHIAINWGTADNYVIGGSEAFAADELVKTIHLLLSKGYEVSIYPVWIKDIEACKAIAARCDNTKVKFVSEVPDAETLASLVLRSAFTINFKLHAAIISAALGCPFISLGYRGKCFEFADSIGAFDYCISTADCNLHSLTKLVDKIETDYEELILSYEMAKADYRNEFLNSFKEMSKLIN